MRWLVAFSSATAAASAVASAVNDKPLPLGAVVNVVAIGVIATLAVWDNR